MRTSMRSVVAELARDVHGTEIAEAAAVLPIMFMILLGIFWFGQAFSIYGAITRAAQEGARAGSIAYCATCSGKDTLAQLDANAATAITAALQASQLNPLLAQPPSPPPTLLSCQDSTPVTCAGGSANFCIQSPIQLSSSNTGATGLCGVSVTFQYPFQFWLPFTSLNKQLVWIQASARVKQETQ